MNKSKIVKKGTIAIDIVETTPIVWKNKLLRFEWKRNFNSENVDYEHKGGYYHFVDMQDDSETAPFAHTYCFGSAYTENETMYVVATKEWGGNVIDMFVSKDLANWQKRNILTLPKGWQCYNTSLCKDSDGYVLAIEISKPKKYAGVPFTIIFARSKNLFDWEILDPNKHVHTKDRYSACPVIRYIDEQYYMIYLEEMPLYKFVPYIARSKDLKTWDVAAVNPVLFYSDEDKILDRDFSEKEKKYILESINTNNSDVDLCEFNGKTIILYSWGDQRGREFLAHAEYDGSMEEFLKSFF